jgi:23S rRNA pseudouridine1911/1915/1917 synthase
VKLFDVIHEDDELLVINKPAGLVCHPTKGDQYSSLISRVRIHLGDGSRPHLVNRLDRETSGVTLVAKTDDVALSLRRIWETRKVSKEYFAIVHGAVRDQIGVINAPLGKDVQSRVAIKDCVRPDGLPSETRYKLERVFTVQGSLFSLLCVKPETGRKHQIRVHLSHLGHPIVGDKLYGGDEDLYLALVENRVTTEQKQRLMVAYQALHARQVRFVWNGVERVFSAEPETWFNDFLNGRVPKIESEHWPI